MKFTSQVLTAASGSIGGVTYSRNRGGMYQRARAIPSNPGTERQGVARENLATAVGYWTNTLTAAQRASWTDYAAATPFTDSLAQPITLTGQQIFIRTSTIRNLCGLDQVMTGPVMPGLGNTPQWTGDPNLYEDTQAIDGDLTAAGSVANDIMAIYVSRPVNPSRTPAHEPRRWAAAQLYTALGTHYPIAGVSPFFVTEGQLVRVTAVAVYFDGRISAEAYRDVLVQATGA